MIKKTALFQILSVSFRIYTEIERYLYKTKAFWRTKLQTKPIYCHIIASLARLKLKDSYSQPVATENTNKILCIETIFGIFAKHLICCFSCVFKNILCQRVKQKRIIFVSRYSGFITRHRRFEGTIFNNSEENGGEKLTLTRPKTELKELRA